MMIKRSGARPVFVPLALSFAIAACDRSPANDAVAVKPNPVPAAPPPPVARAPVPTPPPPPVTLVLTWMPPDQPPQTTQMGFRDLASCERAREEAIAESRRLASESAAPTRGAPSAPVERHYVGNTLISGAPPPPPSTPPPPPPPRVAAICAGG